MFLNLTNHPSDKWQTEQREAALAYGPIVDYPFPLVEPTQTAQGIEGMAQRMVADILAKYGRENLTVHVMGEFTLSYQLIRRFQLQGIPCVASTTQRVVEEPEPGKKVAMFKFIQFRPYGNI